MELENTYWAENGEYQEEVENLDNLLPLMGPCETLKGEIWRAASKIYHDFYNNGFGNFWVEPAKFLMDHIQLPEEVKQVLLEHGNGNVAEIDYFDEMEMMIDETIIQLKEFHDEKNIYEMLDYISPEYYEFKEECFDYEC